MNAENREVFGKGTIAILMVAVIIAVVTLLSPDPKVDSVPLNERMARACAAHSGVRDPGVDSGSAIVLQCRDLTLQQVPR